MESIWLAALLGRSSSKSRGTRKPICHLEWQWSLEGQMVAPFCLNSENNLFLLCSLARLIKDYIKRCGSEQCQLAGDRICWWNCWQIFTKIITCSGGVHSVFSLEVKGALPLSVSSWFLYLRILPAHLIPCMLVNHCQNGCGCLRLKACEATVPSVCH